MQGGWPDDIRGIIEMKRDDDWVLFETEVNDLKPPHYVVEIAAHRMRGWEPDGLPFRVLLNHGVPIEIRSQAAHGISAEELRDRGQDPKVAHSLFREYVGKRRLVSHNLPMDLGRVLNPELERLGLQPFETAGFCALTLARRVLPEATSYSLTALNRRFGLQVTGKQGAARDIEILKKLFQAWIGPRMEAAGISGFEAVAAFSREASPKRCRAQIEKAVRDRGLPTPEVEEAVPPTPEETLKEYLRLIHQIMEDGSMSTAEFLTLMDWLRQCPHTDVYPINLLQEAAERVTESGGVVTREQQERLEAVFKEFLKTGKIPVAGGPA